MSPLFEALQTACRRSNSLSSIISDYGENTIEEYLTGLNNKGCKGYQGIDDLKQVVFAYVKDLIGAEMAGKASERLECDSRILTSNHHGVDYFSQSVQSSILFSLRNFKETCFSGPAVIFSCGAVPLDNLTYPLGMLLYGASGIEPENVPKKLPIFPNRLRRSMVSTAGPLKEDMIARALHRIVDLEKKRIIEPCLSLPIDTLLKECYGSKEVAERSSYSEQAVILNHMTWGRLFARSSCFPTQISLELEHVVKKLLFIDLQDKSSLIWQLFFNSCLRSKILFELDGEAACWDIRKLKTRSSAVSSNQAGGNGQNGAGTIFFWGTTEKGGRVPLHFESGRQAKDVLQGIDDKANPFEFPFHPDSLCERLAKKQLIPSLFTCFAVLSFARAVTCTGGYYQREYLPKMQKGVVSALRQTPGCKDIAPLVASVRTADYLSGMQTVMTPSPGSGLVPAGPLEIIAGGGLSRYHIEKILSMKVKTAHMASLSETLPDIDPRESKRRGLKGLLARECQKELRDQVVVL